jgi:hypothetical protein
MVRRKRNQTVAPTATARDRGTGEETDGVVVVVVVGGAPVGGILVGGSEAMPTEQTIVTPTPPSLTPSPPSNPPTN